MSNSLRSWTGAVIGTAVWALLLWAAILEDNVHAERVAIFIACLTGVIGFLILFMPDEKIKEKVLIKYRCRSRIVFSAAVDNAVAIIFIASGWWVSGVIYFIGANVARVHLVNLANSSSE